MAKIAILGFGTVGSGVYEVLCRNAAGVSRRAGEPVEVKYILDPKDFSAHPAAQLFIKNFDTILEDPEVKVVVETIGGTRFAYPYVKACLESGRSVCTSNKEMVATYGAELLALAKAHNCAFLFEASVGGGTPIITPMHQCLAANVITEVEGIVNGTTNFMLTKMVRENLGFDEALKIAQELGYAETKDPGDDVDGRDACRKIAILSSLVCGHQIYPQNIPTRGIRDITAGDVAAAEKLGCVIKLIAWMKRGEDGSVAAGVEPCLVPKVNQLAGVDDVFNAVLVKGDMLGDVVFYGKGAGKLPTASAVVADVVDALKNGSKVHDSLFWQPAEPVEGMLTDPAPAAYYVRVEGIAPAVAEAIYGKGHVVDEHFDGCCLLRGQRRRQGSGRSGPEGGGRGRQREAGAPPSARGSLSGRGEGTAMKIKVSVPATSANIGSGFDALGLAVTLYNTVTFEESDHLDISAADGTRIPRGESNLVYRSAKGLFDKVGKTMPPLKLVQTNAIPMARGLGSSSACIIAGLLGANRMLGDVLNTQELLTLATSIEGHPDNVAPALLGGLTSSVFEDGVVYSVKRDVDESLCFAAIVPDYKLLTEAARAALPKEVTHKDAVYNLSRAALIPAAFCEGRHDLLAIATEDKLHQPYRMPLMPGSKEVFDMARLCGAKAVYVSGAGSTVMAVAEKASAEKFYSKLEKGLELLEGLDGCEAFTLLRLDADNTGATVE